MYQLTKISTAIAALGLSTILFMGQSIAVTSDVKNDTVEGSAKGTATKSTESNSKNQVTSNNNDVSPVTNGVSQKVAGKSKTAVSLNKFLPTIKYTTENLPMEAQKVNSATWKQGMKRNRDTTTKLQALLNWHQNGVGAVDGYWGKNSRKAMQAFQMANGLAVTDTLNIETWQALTKNDKLMAQPVLVNYQLTDADINIKTTVIPAGAEAKSKLEGMYYETVIEGLAEKFHISESYLKALNPNAKFALGETITVYNPGNPNIKPVSRVVADKATETLYAYDDKGILVASYPTTVGSTATPSPTGTHTVAVKVHEPNYTYTAENGSKSILPPGPNNPVGSVWIGLSKPSYGIHGSPDPARISRQASAGCIRLTNWDALALLGVIQSGATVEFK
ncbi:L,D-transpeptidase family protein [Psychrobacter cryohalolentis]|uniref:ErfK/YbiS/YcfS/YnhG n=1 Tax=Psychrobacter cryohalolentis (strain ATCC BAA-1226 / DSM 17306 / VKM B-2378 / K5) TaxID=335284 RepID=Q1QAF6_PSYCK|nr:L,D-transpeptidase family protein [Psychrobacter cryohalolentis]ABE75347.1 ErfK/YbiS/YcfS/YnhG [Psychrobacter cryohalolentis K5]ASE25538.1 murein L,D-transpeptidase [Psychrobacter cryohalolentis]